MIYAETERLILRSLEQDDLPRVAELIGDWDVARWLSVVPHPYTIEDAREFYTRMQNAVRIGAPEYFLIEQKKDGQQVGAVGLHPPRELHPTPGKLMIGYWLGKKFWGQGLMTEAIRPVIRLAFERPTTGILVADANPDNQASQNVLRKSGFDYLGIVPCRHPKSVRSPAEVTTWRLTREDFDMKKHAA